MRPFWTMRMMRELVVAFIICNFIWEVLALTNQQDAKILYTAVGGDVTCVIMQYEQIKCFGRGEFRQLGNKSPLNLGDSPSSIGQGLPTVKLGFSSVKQVAVGARHACSVSENRDLKCWGQNSFGELGQVDKDTHVIRFSSPGLKVDQVATGDSFTCVLFTNKQVLCFGKGSNGQLGQGSTQSNGNTATMTRIFLGNQYVLQICCGRRHACALLDDFSVKCWGAGNFGQLGTGSTADVGDNHGEMGYSLDAIRIGTGRSVQHVACGGEHTCVMLDTGQVKCFGRNDKGQLGLGDTIDRGTHPAHMGNNLPPVFLGLDKQVTRIAAGNDFTCAVLDDRSVKCWGNGAHGLLLTGHSNNVGDEADEMTLLKPINLGMYTYHVSDVYAGVGGSYGHVCVHVSAKTYISPGDLICWGNGQFGQRGVGTNHSFGGLPSQIHNTTVLPLANLGPPRLPRISLFTELSKDLGSFPCIKTTSTIPCRIVNITNGALVKHKTVVIYPEGPDVVSLHPPIVLRVVRRNEMGADLSVEFRQEGEMIHPFFTQSAYIHENGDVNMELSVRGGRWMLYRCPQDQPYPGDKSGCYLWESHTHTRWTDIIPTRRKPDTKSSSSPPHLKGLDFAEKGNPSSQTNT